MSESLTDFILARVAEDEAVASERSYPGGRSYVLGAGVVDVIYVEREADKRVLAECAAKRQIVEECVAGLEYDIGCGEGHYSNFDAILRHLAQPYASHPDFDPAWRLP